MISETPPIISYTYIGPGNYTFPFTIRKTEHLQIELETNGLVLNISPSYYTVNWDSAVQGGSIDITYPLPAEGGVLTIKRILPISQPEQWGYNSVFSTALLESSLDNIVMIIQQLSADFTSSKVVTNWRQDWVPGVLYSLGDFVFYEGDIYLCLVPHISGTFATDLASLKWTLIFATQSSLDLYDQVLAAVAQAEAAAAQAESAILAANQATDAADAAAAAATEAASRPFLGSTGYAGHFAQGFNAAAYNRDRIRVSHGITMDSTNMHTMNGPLLDKDFRVTWAEGNQQGGRVGTGTMENARIDVWIIGKDDGTCDYAFSAGSTGTWNLPSGYTRKQYLFSFRTFAGGQAAYFTKKGKYVYFHEAHNSVINWNVPTLWTTPDHDSFVHPTYTELIKFGVSALGTSGTSYLQYSANGNDGTINYTIAENNNLHEAISGLVWGGYGSGGPWYPFHNTGKVKREGDAGIRLLVMGYKIL
jgi:hypothetical protein